MSSTDADDDVAIPGDDEAGGSEDGKPARKFSKKKLILFIGVPLLLIIGGVAAAFLLVDFGGEPEAAAAAEEHKTEDGGHGGGEAAHAGGPVVFFDLPDMLVNLNTGSKQASYLKIKIALELPGADAQQQVQTLLPRVLDSFQVYLRELRIEDLSGSAGTYRLKEELITRVNSVIKPAKVNDVLFKEMLVQ